MSNFYQDALWNIGGALPHHNHRWPTASNEWQREILKCFEEAQKGNIYPGAIYSEAQMAETETGRLLKMLAMRMGWDRTDPGILPPIPFEHIACHQVSPEKVYVFVVHNGEAEILEDGNLFPSDQLITQLRLMAG